VCLSVVLSQTVLTLTFCPLSRWTIVGRIYRPKQPVNATGHFSLPILSLPHRVNHWADCVKFEMDHGTILPTTFPDVASNVYACVLRVGWTVVC